jgi:hypothetical protein
MWISGGVTALTLAASIRNAIDPRLIVVLGMSLRTDLKDSRVPNTANDLFEQLDKWTLHLSICSDQAKSLGMIRAVAVYSSEKTSATKISKSRVSIYNL